MMFHQILILWVLVAFCTSCDGRRPHGRNTYGNGFFIANEGWYGHETGSVSFYCYRTESISLNVYSKENPDKPLGTNTTTLQYGTIFHNRLYLVVKAGGPLVESNAYTLKELRRIATLPGDNGQSFLGIDHDEGLLGAGDGLYRVDLATFTIGAAVAGVTGAIGDLAISGDRVFAIADNQQLYILSANGYGIERQVSGVTAGFAVTEDGQVWALGTDRLLGIRPDLNEEQVQLSFTLPNGSYAWRPGPMAYSEPEDAVFFVRQTESGDGTEIYRYVIGDSGSVSEPFITVPQNYSIYGSIGYDGHLQKLVVNVIRSGWGQNSQDNLLLFYDPVNGTLESSVPYEGFYFPAMVIFH